MKTAVQELLQNPGKPTFCSWLQNVPFGRRFRLKTEMSRLTLTKIGFFANFSSVLRRDFATAKSGKKKRHEEHAVLETMV
jgi:hypothetical protein